MTVQLATVNVNDKALELERTQLAKSGSLHWFHWLIVIASALLTLAAWRFLTLQFEERDQARFQREATRAIELVAERMRKYEDALWAGVASLQAAEARVTHAQWRSYAQSLRIEQKYPGINGIGLIRALRPDQLAQHLSEQRLTRPDYRVHPEHEQSELMPIVYIEPEAPNQKAVGLDMAHEANRYAAAKRARATGDAQITGPIVLVQDEGSTAGFLFYAPFMNPQAVETPVYRAADFEGLVYAPFVVKKLMDGTMAKDRRHVSIRLLDGDEVIYDEHTPENADYDPTPLFRQRSSVSLYGRNWTFDISSAHSFHHAASARQPLIVLIGGLSIDALLLTLFLLLSRSSRRALSFADRVTAALNANAMALGRSNADLESFAYIASHDLKTPVRGVDSLTTYLEEDLQPYLESADANPEVQRNLDRLHQQALRMDHLIAGILDYSRVGYDDEVSRVDVAQLVASVCLDQGVRDDQLRLDPTLPVFETVAMRFSQVLNNLIGNAFKYHHDTEHAVVTVSWKDHPEHYEFVVADNGPGIEPQFHERIFEPFQTLQPKDQIESTGIGLAIVKKTVEGLGGRVRVVSTVGAGASFSFEWPKVIHTSASLRKVG